MNLEDYGWSSFFSENFEPFDRDGLTPGRVALEHRGRYRVWTADGEVDAGAAGRLRRDADGRGGMPAVGDWVALDRADDSSAVIRGVVPRRGAFSRKVAGARSEQQVVAANIDTVFLVSGLDGDLNVRRVERYLTIAWNGGARPVVVLNKADVCDDLSTVRGEVERVAPGVPVVAVSARASELDALTPFLRVGETVALIGSSGVGKSTITNRLLGESPQRTAAVRSGDDKGRHTTTHRELFLLPSGALLVDTPGMREIQTWVGGENDGLGAAFSDVAELAQECRFTDCRHSGEPGCAVDSALKDGRLDEDRFANYVALEREIAHVARKSDARLRLAEKQRWKVIHKAMRRQD